MSLTFDQPAFLYASLALLAAAIVILLLRRPRLGRLSMVLLILGLACFALAAAVPVARLPVPPRVAVLVDLSPSTRTAAYRDRAILDRRLRALLPGVDFDLLAFADATAPLPDTPLLPDFPADRTVYAPPPAADVVLLFTDARFDRPPTAPPTFIVVDPRLLEARDAAVANLHPQAGAAIATVRNTGDPRRLTWSGAAPQPVEPGTVLLSHPLADQPLTARLDPADPWPENDALTLAPPPPAQTQRWWISSRPPPAGDWRAIAPGDLPDNPVDYLDPEVIVLDNIPAGAMPEAHRLVQYVRDLGGAVVLLGGDAAFAAGGYDGTALDTLSPLSASPPAPRRHWLLLTDASGSMAAPVGVTSRWSLATAALRQALGALPANDRVSVGGFADRIDWWLEDASIADARASALPPADAQPLGSTNLQPALQQIAAAPAGAMPRDLLLLTDAQATLDAPDDLARSLRKARIRLHVLLTGDGPAAGALRAIASQTDGRLVEASSPGDWAARATALARSATAEPLVDHAVQLRPTAGAPLAVTLTVSSWNRTWLKPGATLLVDAVHNDQAVPMIARWPVGTGRVLAAAFSPSPGDAHALADTIARPPADPRFAISIDPASDMRIRIEARTAGGYLNDLPLVARLTDAQTSRSIATPIGQVAPGVYELTLPSPRSPAFLALLHDGSLLHQQALAGRYPPEFDAVGFDVPRAQTLAEATGGRVIGADHAEPLDLPVRRDLRPLTLHLTLAGLLACALALVAWRRG